jgi:hypothetical protein
MKNMETILGLKLQSLSVIISNNAELNNILKEIALKSIEIGWKIQSFYSKLGIILLFKANKIYNFNILQEQMLKRELINLKIFKVFKLFFFK